MKKLIKNILGIALVMAGIFYVATSKDDMYFRKHLSQAVHPVQIFYFGQFRNVGTSFQILHDKKRYTVTNKHVCHPPLQQVKKNHIFVKGKMLKILYIAPHHDICIVEPYKGSLSLKLSQYKLEKLEDVYVIGFPRGMEKTMRKGYVTKIDYGKFSWVTRHAIEYIKLAITAYPGNSGSPILNEGGFVGGILFAGYSSYHTEAMVVPVEYLKKALREMNDKHYTIAR